MSRALGTAGLGFALCLAGASFDTPSLYVPGVALIGLSVVVTTWVRLAARGAQVVREAGPHTVVEDEPWPLRLRLNSGVLPPPGGDLVEPLLGWPVPIGGRWSRRIRINVRFSRRGRRHLEPARLVVRDPLRLKTTEVVGEGGEEVLVLPRVEPVEPVRASGSGAGADLGGDQGKAGGRLDAATAELDIDGLRPYREGAPASRIHWPAVARSGEMLERRLVAELDSAPLIVLDASRPASEDDLDAAVRAAGSLCVELGRRGGCAVLLPRERRPTEIGPELGAWPQIHVRLALVEAGGGPPALGHRPRGGAVIWVTGAAVRRPPKGLERVAAASCWIVSPGEPLEGFRPAFTVAGCTGQRVDRVRRPSRPAPGRQAA